MDTIDLLKVIIVTITVFVINIPFGYWRGSVKKFSVGWFLAVHIPVILAVLLRYLVSMEFSWYRLPFFVIAFFFGQRMGTIWYSNRLVKNSVKI